MTISFVKTHKTALGVNFTLRELHIQQQILKENLLLRLQCQFLVVDGNSVMCDLKVKDI